MFLLSLLANIYFIYFMAAVLPAAILLIYVYRKDKVEKEPPSLLFRLLIAGVIAALLSIVLETVGENALNLFISPYDPAYSVLLAFLVVAAVEEGTKYVLLKRRTWKHPAFNYRFDGIVYAVFVSLGFAAFENISYVFGYGLSVAPARALLAIPGHMSFAVFMGSYYGRAKMYEREGYPGKAKANRILGYLSAVFLHGFYDTCCMMASDASTIVFIIFIIILFVTVFRRIKKESRDDRQIY